MNTIEVVKKLVGKGCAFDASFDHSFGSLQKTVGGHLELVRLPYRIDLWLNEEGKLDGLPVNLVYYINGKVVDHICGDVLFASHDNEGETISLHSEQVQWINQNVRPVGLGRNKEGEEYLVYALYS